MHKMQQLLHGVIRQQGRNFAAHSRSAAVSASIANTRLAVPLCSSAPTTTSSRALQPVVVEARSALSSQTGDVAGAMSSVAADGVSLEDLSMFNAEEDETRARRRAMFASITPVESAPRPTRAEYAAKYDALFARRAEIEAEAAKDEKAAAATVRALVSGPARAAAQASPSSDESSSSSGASESLMSAYAAARDRAMLRRTPHSSLFRGVTGDARDDDQEYLRSDKKNVKSGRGDSISRTEADDLSRAGMLAGIPSQPPLKVKVYAELGKGEDADPELARRMELLRKSSALDLGSAGDIRRAKTAALISQYQRREGDTGSAEVQVAVLTERINVMELHRSRNKQDKQSNRQYFMLLGQRRRMMEYLKRQRFRTYQVLVRDLELDEVAIFSAGQTANARPYLAEHKPSRRVVPLAVRPVDVFRKLRAKEEEEAREAELEAKLDEFDRNLAVGGGYASFLAATRTFGKK